MNSDALSGDKEVPTQQLLKQWEDRVNAQLKNLQLLMLKIIKENLWLNGSHKITELEIQLRNVFTLHSFSKPLLLHNFSIKSTLDSSSKRIITSLKDSSQTKCSLSFMPLNGFSNSSWSKLEEKSLNVSHSLFAKTWFALVLVSFQFHGTSSSKLSHWDTLNSQSMIIQWKKKANTRLSLLLPRNLPLERRKSKVFLNKVLRSKWRRENTEC